MVRTDREMLKAVITDKKMGHRASRVRA